MASILQKLIRKPSSSTLITNFSKQILTSSNSTHLSDFKPESSAITAPFFDGVHNTTDESNPSHSLRFYPSFSFGGFLNPISRTGFVQYVDPDEEIVSGNDDLMIRADSVKKKRKKKMNKHKLKKLRKRLQRKT